MVQHICDFCNKIFEKKSHLTQHLNKKKTCNLNQDINLDIVIQKNTKIAPKSTRNAPKSTKNVPFSTSDKSITGCETNDNSTNKKKSNLDTGILIKKSNSDYKCNYCNMTFTRSTTLKRHLIDRCKIRKEENKDKEEIFKKLLEKYEEMKYLIEEKDEKINNLIKEKNNKIINLIKEKDYKINKLTKELENLKQKTNTKNIQNNNGTVINQNNGTINNTINNINIIQHGKEDLSKLETSIFLDAFLKYSGAKIPERIVEGIHFNDKHSEFKNIYISDINREKVMTPPVHQR
jgi:hypothetical protein